MGKCKYKQNKETTEKKITSVQSLKADEMDKFPQRLADVNKDGAFSDKADDQTYQ